MKRGEDLLLHPTAQPQPLPQLQSTSRWTPEEMNAFFDVCYHSLYTCYYHIGVVVSFDDNWISEQGFEVHGRDFALVQRDFLPHKEANKIKYMYNKIVKQINGIIAPQTVSRRDQLALKRIFASYRSMVLLRPADEDDHQAADLLVTMSDGGAAYNDSFADSTTSPRKCQRLALRPEEASFRRVVESMLSSSSSSSTAASSVPASAVVAATGQPLPLSQPAAFHPHPGGASIPVMDRAPSRTPSFDRSSPGPEQKISLCCAPLDINTREIVERCGCNPYLVLTFRMTKRTLGSIIRHLAIKWFTNVQLRNLTPSARAQEAVPHQPRDPTKKKPKKPAAVRFGMNHITLNILHADNGAVIGTWDKSNTTSFSEYLPNLPTSISAPVLASPDTPLTAFYSITGITDRDIIRLNPPAPEQQQSQAPAAAAAQPSIVDSIPHFQKFGQRTSSSGGSSAAGQRKPDGAAPGPDIAPDLNRIDDDPNNIVQPDKSITSFILGLGNNPPELSGLGLSRQGFNGLLPSIQPASGTAGVPSVDPSPVKNRTAGASAAGTASPEKAQFFSFSATSRDGLPPREESQIPLFQERSTGFSNSGFSFPLVGSGASSHGFSLFHGNTLGQDSNF